MNCLRNLLLPAMEVDPATPSHRIVVLRSRINDLEQDVEIDHLALETLKTWILSGEAFFAFLDPSDKEWHSAIDQWEEVLDKIISQPRP